MRDCLTLNQRIFIPNTMPVPYVNLLSLQCCGSTISSVTAVILTILTTLISVTAIEIVIKIVVSISILWVRAVTIVKLVVIKTVLMLKTITNDLITCLYYRSARLRMAGNSLGRSLSLHDVADRSSSLRPPTTALSASALDVRGRLHTEHEHAEHKRTQTAISRTAAAAASVEEGLALLGDSTTCIDHLEHAGINVDNNILDYESDCSDFELHTTQAPDTLPLSTAMETDSEPAAGAPQEFDAMYYQCKSARLASRTDVFFKCFPGQLVREGCLCSITSVWLL
jgi:hypothetical protein